MNDAKLFAKKRVLEGGANTRRLRKTGALPGVIYGGQEDPVSIQLVAHDFERLLHGHASESLIVEVDLDGEGLGSVLVKEVQHHPVTGEMVHVDLQRVAADRLIHVEIPLELAGEAAGVKLGGTLEHVTHAIMVECLPGDLVDSFAVDVTGLGIGDSLHVSDLALGDRYRVMAEADGIVVAVSAARVAEEEPGEAAGAEEPELVAKKKADENG